MTEITHVAMSILSLRRNACNMNAFFAAFPYRHKEWFTRLSVGAALQPTVRCIVSVGIVHSENSRCASSERDVFFSTLFHDDRKSSYAVATCIDGVWSESMHKSQHLPFLGSPQHGSFYVSINGFSRNHRRYDSLRQINALFFDLDCHTSSQEIAKQAIDQAFALIEQGAATGDIPRPTLVVDSGRGLHIYYVLKRSIPYRSSASGPVNEKVLRLFRFVQQHLSYTLSRLMASVSAIDVDQKVFDFTRVSRVPGSYNPEAGRHARLLMANDDYYDLRELTSTFSECQPTKHTSSSSGMSPSKHFRQQGNDNPLLQSRLDNLVSLQSLRNFNCEGSRELMCFVFYNTAVQLFGTKVAFQRLASFNARFSQPLAAQELEGVSRSVDRVVNVRGQRGFYILGAEKISELLALTEEEKHQIRFHTSTRALKREQAKRKTALCRTMRNQKILALYLEGNLTQAEVAKEIDCSLRTVASVISKWKREERTARRTTWNVTSLVIQQLLAYVKQLPNGDDGRKKNNIIIPFNNFQSKVEDICKQSPICRNTINLGVHRYPRCNPYNKQHKITYNKTQDEHAIFCHTCLPVVRPLLLYEMFSVWVV